MRLNSSGEIVLPSMTGLMLSPESALQLKRRFVGKVGLPLFCYGFQHFHSYYEIFPSEKRKSELVDHLRRPAAPSSSDSEDDKRKPPEVRQPSSPVIEEPFEPDDESVPLRRENETRERSNSSLSVEILSPESPRGSSTVALTYADAVRRNQNLVNESRKPSADWFSLSVESGPCKFGRSVQLKIQKLIHSFLFQLRRRGLVLTSRGRPCSAVCL